MNLFGGTGRNPAPPQRPGAAPRPRGGRFAALLVAPNRSLGRQFLSSCAGEPDLSIESRVDAYPAPETLGGMIRSQKPDLLLLDLSSDLQAACALIRSVAAACPDVHVIGLHERKDAEALMSSLRMGATEFLYSPFDADETRGALARIDRLRRAAGVRGAESGRILAFTSAKPGAGASTLAAQTAFTLRGLTRERTLLVDLDLHAGLLGAALAPSPRCNLLDGLEEAESLDPAKWSSLTQYAGEIDVLPAPPEPYVGDLDPARLQRLLASARRAYEWIVLDLPVLFNPLTQLTLAEVDRGFIVTTTELPSLHLARRAAEWIRHSGFDRDRYQLVVNRAVFSARMDRAVMEQVLDCRVFATIPNDYAALHKLSGFGDTPGPKTELGSSLRKFAASLAGLCQTGSDAPARSYALNPLLAR